MAFRYMPYMAWSATEQLPQIADAAAEMTVNATERGLQLMPVGPIASAGHMEILESYGTLEIHVDRHNDMWWVMPHTLGRSILEQWFNGAQQVSFVWDWQRIRGRRRSQYSRYTIDFDTMWQRNLDSGGTRKVKVVCVPTHMATATELGLQLTPYVPAASPGHGKLEIHMEFNDDIWWAMPQTDSDGILMQTFHGAQEVPFVWDWERIRGRRHSRYSRYIINFNTMRQHNLDSSKTRKVKVVYVLRCTA